MTLPLTVGRPRLGPDRARALARERWGLEVREVRPLPSDRDANFLVRTPSGARFVLKVFNGREEPAVVELQDRMMERLRERGPGLGIPRVRPTPDGERVVEVAVDPGAGAEEGEPTGGRHLARLVTWVEGRPLARIRPQGDPLLRRVGRFLGGLSRALEGFRHPAADRPFPWNLRHGPASARGRLAHLGDPDRRRLVERHLSRWEEWLDPLASNLRSSVIHGDANDHNVLLGPLRDGAEGWTREVTGLIDFGDAVGSWTVAEPAVAAAYAVLGKDDPVGAAAAVLAGYHEMHPLTEPEVEAYHALLALRLCLSVTIGGEQTAREPDNAYLAVSQDGAWEALARLDAVSPELAHYTYRSVCGWEPCPRHRTVVEWLGRHGEEAAAVTDPDPRSGRGRVLDLGAGSADPVAGPRGGRDRPAGGLGEEPGTASAVGRWGEARCEGTDGRTGEARNDGDEPRTVHLGVDLFLPRGAPVFAPFEGCVLGLEPGGEGAGATVVVRHAPDPDDGSAAFHTLYRHLDPDSLAHLRPGTRLARGERIGAVGRAFHLHFQVMVDPLGLGPDFPGTAPPDRRDVWTSLSPDPNLLLRIPGLEPAPSPPATREMVERRHRLLGRGLSLSYRRPLRIVRGWRHHLYDDEGRAYLDCVNNVPHVGHSHPRVVEAAHRQMAVLNTNTRYLHQRVLEYAERLAATFPDPLSVCFFVNSGSEANELALRLAGARTGARDVIVLEGGYHGNTGGLVAISPYKFDGPGGEGAPPWVHTVPMPDPYRGRYRGDAPDAGERYARHVAEAVERIRERGDSVRAIFAEPILSCGGQIVPPPGFLARAFEHVREAGGVSVADEVQIGFGRVGSHFWGFDAQGAVPDIVTLGKPMGNGHPLGAVVTTPEVARAFETGMEYFSTFGGNPVSCAVGLAVLDVLEEEGLQENARAVGARFRDGLAELGERHPIVGDVRGSGLFLGIELVRDRDSREPAGPEAGYLVERMRERRILLSTDGPDANVVKIKPPLTFTAPAADRVVAEMDAVLEEDFLRRE